jgi:uncharacterized protein (DUF1778 family)
MALILKKQQRQARKVARIEARLNPEQKRRIEYAARLKGTSISDFMVLSADDAAARAIQEHEVWVLADRDREVFVRALLNPPAPSARMKAAAQRYRRQLGASWARSTTKLNTESSRSATSTTVRLFRVA